MKKAALIILLFFIITKTWSQPAIPNFDFENWHIYTRSWGQPLYDPNDWLTSNFDPGSGPANGYLVVRDTQSFNGQYSARILDNGVERNWVSTQFATTLHPQNLTAYIKCDIYTPDTVSIRADILLAGMVVDSGVWYGTSSIPSYQFISIPITQNSTLFDSIRIYIAGGIHLSLFPVFQSTIFWIDYLQFDQFPSIAEGNLASTQLQINPNPASASTIITAQGNFNANLTLNDAFGRVLLHQLFFNELNLNTSSLSPGIYFIEINDKAGRKLQGKLVKQ